MTTTKEAIRTTSKALIDHIRTHDPLQRQHLIDCEITAGIMRAQAEHLMETSRALVSQALALQNDVEKRTKILHFVQDDK